MPYRRVDLIVSSDTKLDLEKTCKGLGLLDVIHDQTHDEDRHSAHLLVHAESAEPVMQRLEETFGEDDRFRATLIEIAAMVPRLEEQDKPDEQDPKELKASRGRISRNELMEDLEPGTKISKVFITMVTLSTIIAAIGLIRDSTAVVIGAMVIAPVLLPNMSLSLGTALGDWSIVWRSLVTNAVGVAVALAIAIGIGLLVPFDPTVNEIASRRGPTLSDVPLALAAGCAGALAVTTGVSANLIGVMVAVALLPPLVAFGLLIGAGEYAMADGTALLVVVYLVSINLAGVATFYTVGIRPGTWYEEKRANKAILGSGLIWSVALILVIFVMYKVGFWPGAE